MKKVTRITIRSPRLISQDLLGSKNTYEQFALIRKDLDWDIEKLTEARDIVRNLTSHNGTGDIASLFPKGYQEKVYSKKKSTFSWFYLCVTVEDILTFTIQGYHADGPWKDRYVVLNEKEMNITGEHHTLEEAKQICKKYGAEYIIN